MQAFDDGAHTYLQFDNAPRDVRVQSGNDSTSLPVRIKTPFVTFDGVYSQLVVSRQSNFTVIVNESADWVQARVPAAGDVMPPEPASTAKVEQSLAHPQLAAVGIPESQQTMLASLRVTGLNRAIEQLQERIRVLSDHLDQTHQDGKTANVYLRSAKIGPRLVLMFDDNSAVADLDHDILTTLGAAARAANRIYLHGHTDAFVATNAGTDLAVRRAVAVRQLLLSQNVAADRVRLFYRGAGNFIANNGTPAGKASNRRVEIELRKW